MGLMLGTIHHGAHWCQSCSLPTPSPLHSAGTHLDTQHLSWHTHTNSQAPVCETLTGRGWIRKNDPERETVHSPTLKEPPPPLCHASLWLIHRTSWGTQTTVGLFVFSPCSAFDWWNWLPLCLSLSFLCLTQVESAGWGSTVSLMKIHPYSLLTIAVPPLSFKSSATESHLCI